jgi:integrase
MKHVEPIRDLDKIAELKSNLNDRDSLLFTLGINVGLRISDILKLKVCDVKTNKLTLKEQKTGKTAYRNLANIRIELDRYIENKPDSDYLFKSRVGENKPITRFQAWHVLSYTCKSIGITNIGTHTLRKTFGYHYYKNTKDISTLQVLFNHSSVKETLRYIGYNQDVIDDNLKNFKL